MSNLTLMPNTLPKASGAMHLFPSRRCVCVCVYYVERTSSPPLSLPESLEKGERELKEMVRNRGGEYPAAQVRL